jgi:hypothetical protein
MAEQKWRARFPNLVGHSTTVVAAATGESDDDDSYRNLGIHLY